MDIFVVYMYVLYHLYCVQCIWCCMCTFLCLIGCVSWMYCVCVMSICVVWGKLLKTYRWFYYSFLKCK